MDTYEKKYKEALERAKKGECLESIFPELKNSKISKEIIKHLISFNNGCYKKPSEDIIDNWVAWLEKQGEHKSVWSEEDEKFFKTTLWHITNSVSNGKSTDVHCDTTDWLKSLKDRVQH